MPDPKVVYADRVDWYVHGRPSYPRELLDVLGGRRLDPGVVVADVGSGTGKLTEIFLDNGNPVYAVEPNEAMRHAAEQALGGRPGFVSVAAAAEQTTLPDGSVDLVTAGQALHWFDLPRARAEFVRILRPGGAVLLVWNERPARPSPLRAELELLLGAAIPGYTEAATADRHVTDLATDFFGTSAWTSTVLPHDQRLTEDALLGRVLSASYAPAQGDPAWTVLVDGLRKLHRRHAVGGTVRLDYDTWVIHGHL